MKKPQNILVPTDFSSNSANALQYAVNLSIATESIIHVLHCIEPILGVRNSVEEQKLIQEGITRLQLQMKKFISSAPECNHKIIEVIKTGKAYEQILSYSRDSAIDLIVLAANGWSNSQDAILGTVAEKVTRYSTIPVILIKNNDLAGGVDYKAFTKTLAENWVG